MSPDLLLLKGVGLPDRDQRVSFVFMPQQILLRGLLSSNPSFPLSRHGNVGISTVFLVVKSCGAITILIRLLKNWLIL